MASLDNVLPEGHSTTKPPGFSGDHYAFWKAKMKIFIKANGYKLWKVIEEGDFVPTKTVEGERVNKEPSEFTDNDIQMLELNSKAILMIQSALSQKEYFRVSNLQSAKEMWDALEVAHEGTSGVKERRINQLNLEYELFRMNEGESIRELEVRFTHLINHLAALGKVYSQSSQVTKILGILTDEWQAKATAIEETRGESMRSVTSLFGSLAEYESKMKFRKDLAAEKKKKPLALTSKEDDEDEEEEIDDEEMGLMVRRFRKFFKGGRRFQKGNPSNLKKDQKNQPICYECRKPGHFKAECPSLQKADGKEKRKDRYGKKKAFITSIWGDSSEEEESEAEETANVCLVAEEEEEEDETTNEVTNSDPTYQELQNEYNALHTEFVKIAKEVIFLRKRNFDYEKKAETFECKSCENYIQQNEKLTKTLQKFTKGSETLQVILNNQRCYRDKTGLEYNPNSFSKKTREKGEKPYLKFFKKNSDFTSPYNFCKFCNRKGHSISSCFPRKFGVLGSYKWVPKGSQSTVIKKGKLVHTNPPGPKQVWVPKSN